MKFWMIMLLFMGIWMTITADETISPALDDQLVAIETFISQTRNLPIISPIIRNFPTREDVADFIRNAYEEELALRGVLELSLFYRALGFISPTTDLVAIYTNFIGDQVAGFYNPQTKEINTLLLSGQPLGDSLPFLEQMIYAHEFAHALQDQHFDLLGLQAAVQANADQMMALTVLVEGDATYLMQAYITQLIQNTPGAITAILGESLNVLGNMSASQGVPPIFMKEVEFAYFEGMRFVSQLLAEGGWELVNRAFSELPQATAHILYPEKYLAGHIPQNVYLPDVAFSLGDDWQLATTRHVGVFYLREYLEKHISKNIVRDTLYQWDGDQMTLYYHPDDDALAWLLGIAWETPQGGIDFAETFAFFLENELANWDFTQFCGASDQVAVCFMTTTDKTYIASAPDQPSALAMLEAVMMVRQ